MASESKSGEEKKCHAESFLALQVQIEIHAVIAPELSRFVSVGFSGVDLVDSELFLGDCGLFIGQGNVRDSLIQVRNICDSLIENRQNSILQYKIISG